MPVQIVYAQEWDYTVLMVADPLTRLLELAGTVRFIPIRQIVCQASSSYVSGCNVNIRQCTIQK